MWAVGYVCRMPPALIPSPIVLMLMLIVMLAGGFVLGRYGHQGPWAGACSGTLTAALNLLILGSLLADREQASGAVGLAAWVFGALLLGAVCGALGAWLGRQMPTSRVAPFDWTGAFAGVAAAATFLLLIAGGLVTSHDAGLAVPDWPNSFGYGMFLYPLSRMSGGIYFEHAHRLFGTLVGLNTLALGALLWSTDRRSSIRSLAALAGLLVIVQGVMGGLRVTGGFTLSSSPEELAPNLALAIVHGVTGQLFFALMVVLAVASSRNWRRASSPVHAASAGIDRALSVSFVAVLCLQLVLGALLRHRGVGVLAHITAAAIVAVMAVALGARVWGLYPSQRALGRLALLLLGLIGVQLVLGFVALAVTQVRSVDVPAPWYEVLIATGHQATGALLLAVGAALALWCHRLLKPVREALRTEPLAGRAV
ncbi:MAG: COX15/CtaA family protein [Acidobacteriota bacterium]|nr:MAG: COX15/CtaA family protein [Acidobacteriota bacterium]